MMENYFRNYRFRIGLDADDVLLPCSIQAVEWANRDNLLNPPLTIDEIDSWHTKGRGSVIYDYFKQRQFFQAQKPLPGAQEFVKKLSKKGELFCVTAIEPEFMDIRINQILKYFPQIKKENIIPAYRKDVINLDFLLDDGAHNILASNVKYPVLFRRPWNAHMTGILAVNNYDEFLNLVDCIKDSYVDASISFTRPTVIALVGPSGSGKTEIVNRLLEHSKFSKPMSATTRKRREGEQEEAYHFVSDAEFEDMKKQSLFAETTIYAGNQYGTELLGINNVLKNGQHCLIPIDISGAIALKMQYRTVIIYVKRNKDKLIDVMLQRLMDGSTSKEDTTQRIVSLDDEKKNENICDYVLLNNGTITETVSDILSLLKIKN